MGCSGRHAGSRSGLGLRALVVPGEQSTETRRHVGSFWSFLRAFEVYYIITTWSAPRGPPPPPLSSCAALRCRRLYEWMHAVPAAASHSCGVGCLHPVLDGGQEPLEAKVREGRHTLV